MNDFKREQGRERNGSIYVYKNIQRIDVYICRMNDRELFIVHKYIYRIYTVNINNEERDREWNR